MPRLLLVDDNPSIHKIAESLLEGSDVQLACAESGHQALALVAQGEVFDVALVDIFMAGMDGFALVDAFRMHPGTARMPVAMMAGVLDTVDRARFEAAKVQGLIKKPVELRDLATKIREILAQPVEAPVAPAPEPPAPKVEDISPFATAPSLHVRDFSAYTRPDAPLPPALPEDVLVLTAEDLWVEDLPTSEPMPLPVEAVEIPVPEPPPVPVVTEELAVPDLPPVPVVTGEMAVPDLPPVPVVAEEVAVPDLPPVPVVAEEVAVPDLPPVPTIVEDEIAPESPAVPVVAEETVPEPPPAPVESHELELPEFSLAEADALSVEDDLDLTPLPEFPLQPEIPMPESTALAESLPEAETGAAEVDFIDLSSAEPVELAPELAASSPTVTLTEELPPLPELEPTTGDVELPDLGPSQELVLEADELVLDEPTPEPKPEPKALPKDWADESEDLLSAIQAALPTTAVPEVEAVTDQAPSRELPPTQLELGVGAAMMAGAAAAANADAVLTDQKAAVVETPLPSAPAPVSASVVPANPDVSALVQAILADPVLMDQLATALARHLPVQVLREVAWEVMPEIADRIRTY